MRNYTFNWEIRTVLEQFVGAFNDVVIKRYDKNKVLIPSLSSVKVSYVYGPKTRVFQMLTNPAPGGLTVPIIAVNISSISRDQSRVFNKLDAVNIPYSFENDDLSFEKKIPQPVPINIGINMTIVTKYQNDMDQILSNFVPYCDPYVIISWKIPNADPKNPVEIRSEVLWNGNIALNYPLELAGNQPYRITADTSFTIKGWMFRKMDQLFNKIYVVNSDYTNTNFENQILQDIENYTTENFSISARPQL